MTGRSRVRLRKVVAAGLVSALVLATCSSGSDVSEPVTIEVPRLVTPQRTIGFEPSSGVLRIGILADLSGQGADIARAQVAGAEAYWSTVNAAGGIDGRFPVELVVRDTEGSAAIAIESYRELRERVVLLGQIVGTNTTDAVRALLGADGLVGIPTTRQSFWALTPNLLPVGSSYAVEALSGVSYLAEIDDEPHIWCVVIDRSKEGEDGLLGAVLAAQAMAVVPEFSTLDENGDDRVLDDEGPGTEAATVAHAIAIGCERLWLAGNADTSSRILAASAAADAAFLIGVGSEVDLPLAAEIVGWARDHLVVVVDAPSWGDAGQGARALRGAVSNYVPDVSPNSWVRSGFTSQYTVDVLLTTSVRSGDVSHDAVLSLSKRLAPIDSGGLASSPDWSGDVVVVPTAVKIHVIDQVGVDPMGLRVEREYVAPAVGLVSVDLVAANSG